MFKTMPQAKFNLQSKITIESGKANDKTHLEVSKNFKEAKKIKPSVGQENISQLPNQNPNESKEKNKKIIKK